MLTIYMLAQKEIILLLQDGHTNKMVSMSCTTQDNLFTTITRYCRFAEWDKVSVRIGRAEIDVLNSYNTQDQDSAKNLLQQVLGVFFATAPPIVCTVTVVTKDGPAVPLSRL